MENTVSNIIRHKMNLIISFIKDDILFLNTCFNEDNSCNLEDFNRGYENLNSNIIRISNIIRDMKLVSLIDDFELLNNEIIDANYMFNKLHLHYGSRDFFELKIDYKIILKNCLWYICSIENKFNKM